MATTKPRVDARGMQSFGIASPKDMLEKLRFEVEQPPPGSGQREMKFAGINIAVTAWHLTEWIAVELTKTNRWPEAAKVLKFNFPQQNAEDREKAFMDYAKGDSPEMEAAESIANASKHRERRINLFNGNVHTPDGSQTIQIIVLRDGGVHGMDVSHFGNELIKRLERTMRQLGIATE